MRLLSYNEMLQFTWTEQSVFGRVIFSWTWLAWSFIWACASPFHLLDLARNYTNRSAVVPKT